MSAAQNPCEEILPIGIACELEISECSFGWLITSSSSNTLGIGTDSMSRTTIDIMGTRFVLIPEAELAEIEGPDFPPIADDGTCEALPYIRASIARDIIRERRELGLTQSQLAKLAGIRQETLSRLESGKHKPNVRTVERIEAALKRRQSKR
jgi:DNA-binding XRE family transcriptional regulator